MSELVIMSLQYYNKELKAETSEGEKERRLQILAPTSILFLTEMFRNYYTFPQSFRKLSLCFL